MLYEVITKFRITETEAYRGEEDKACHASKGRTLRTEVMYLSPGSIYIYLIYGMYWMLNIVTEKEDIPQAILRITSYNVCYTKLLRLCILITQTIRSITTIFSIWEREVKQTALFWICHCL